MSSDNEGRRYCVKQQSSSSMALWRESTGDRWIPLTMGQLYGKCFYLMTSSCAAEPSVRFQTIWRYRHIVSRVGCFVGSHHLTTNYMEGCIGHDVFMIHADVIKWKHFPHYWPFVRGIHWSSVNSPHKSQWRGALMFSLICTRINSWVNIREAGD